MATDSRTPSRRPAPNGDGPADDRPWWKQWWVVLLALPAAVVAVVGLLLFFFVFAAVPLPGDVGAAPTVVLDAAGNEVGSLNAQAARQDVPLEQLPAYIPEAVMAAEDRGFYEHSGISITGIARALFANAKAGEVTQGGSTITQQYVKNALVGNDRTFVRKAKEASLALKLEQRYGKDKILDMYLNTIYWGRGAYGIEAAAQTYFDRPAAELSLNQAATLAGIIQSPESLDPADGSDVAARTDERRRYVLAGMLEEGWVDQATHDQVVAEGVPDTTGRQSVEYGPNAYYLDAVRRELAAELGEKEVYTGLTVYTELDQDFQRAAESVMKEALAEQPFTGAIVSVDPRDGGVRALVGGRDFAEQQFNTAVRSARQVGSSFKPFTLTRFVQEGYSPESRFEAPASIVVPDGQGGETEVYNYDQEDHGVETVYEATRRSTNTVYMQMQEEVGAGNVVDTAASLGLPTSRPNDETVMRSVPSLTLGVASFTPLEMASAYATLAAGGVRTTPHLVVKVENSEGEVVHEVEIEQEAVLEANDAYIVTDVLRGVIQNGTGTAADIGRPAAGKTGTTNEYTNAWFTGYVPQLATAVWIGNADNSPLEGEITGGSVPAEIWSAYMSTALEKVEVEDFPAPDLSGKELLNGEPEPSPSPSPSPSPTASPCPDGSGEGGIGDAVDEVLGEGEGGDGQPCPPVTESPTESPSPSPSPTTTEEPTEEPTAEPTTEEPTAEPTTTEEPTAEPSPTEGTVQGQSTGGSGGGSEPSPEPSPTG